MASAKVVFPASTWARIPIVVLFSINSNLGFHSNTKCVFGEELIFQPAVFLSHQRSRFSQLYTVMRVCKLHQQPDNGYYYHRKHTCIKIQIRYHRSHKQNRDCPVHCHIGLISTPVYDLFLRFITALQPLHPGTSVKTGSPFFSGWVF